MVTGNIPHQERNRKIIQMPPSDLQQGKKRKISQKTRRKSRKGVTREREGKTKKGAEGGTPYNQVC